jgi:hypothetical protein
LSDRDRRKSIVDFITSHPGCTREEIDKQKVDVPISRQKIYDLVNELIKEGSIKVTRERVNSRDHKLYPVRNNIFFLIPREFEEVKESYKRLLQLFTDKISIKPTLLNNQIHSKYVSTMNSIIRKMLKELDYYIGLKQSYKDRRWRRNAANLISRLESSTSECLARYRKLKSDDFVDFSLIQYLAIDTFYFINDFYFHRSLLSWSTKVSDKNERNKLNNQLYTTISEMHIQLIEFLDRIKTVNGIPIADTFIRKSLLYPPSLESDFGHYIMKYGLENEIEKILEMLVMACAELKGYNYQPFSRERCESILEVDKKVLELQMDVLRIKEGLTRKENTQGLFNEIILLKDKCKSIIEII